MKGEKDALKTALLLISMLMACSAPSGAYADGMESYHYTETAGQAVKQILWCVDEAQPSQLLYISGDEIFITVTDESFATVAWKMEKKSKHTLLHARRLADAIIIEGHLEDQSIHKVLHIDDAPWYQATSWSLRPFVLSPMDEVRFWTVRVDTLKAYKITATKNANEILKLSTGSEDAVQINLRLKGILAPFWKRQYWFRKADGVFLRFEGPSGPPGAPDLVVEYHGRSTPCDLTAPEQLSGQLDQLDEILQ